jgi:hypothetical protein
MTRDEATRIDAGSKTGLSENNLVSDPVVIRVASSRVIRVPV